MTEEKKANFVSSPQLDLTTHQVEAAVAMPKARWERLMGRISNCQDDFNWLDSLASGAGGAFLATIVPAIVGLAQPTIDNMTIGFLVSAALAAGAGIGLAFAGAQQRLRKTERVTSVLDEMREIEAQFVCASVSVPVAPRTPD